MLQIIFDIVVIILLVLIVWLQISTKEFVQSVHIDLYKNIHLINTRVIQIIGSINILGKDINDLKSIVINRTNHGSKVAQPVTKEQFDKAKDMILNEVLNPKWQPCNKEELEDKTKQVMDNIMKSEMAKHGIKYPQNIPIKDTVSKVTTTKTIVPALKMLRFNLVDDGVNIIVTNKEYDMSFILSSDKRLHYQIRELVKCTCYEEDWFNSPFKIIINKTK